MDFKTFEEILKELIEEGKKNGFLTYEQIAKKTNNLEYFFFSLNKIMELI